MSGAKAQLGLIGFGAFGRLTARHLAPWFDILAHDPAVSDGEGLARIRVQKALAIGATTDILFPLQQQEQIADGLRAGGAQASFLPLASPQGHDAFLVDIERFGPAVAGFLAAL